MSYRYYQIEFYIYSGQRCAHHTNLCEEKINKLCKYVRCDSPEVKEMCPEHCTIQHSG